MAGKQIHDHGEWSDEEPPLLGDDDVKQESAAIGLPLSNQQQEDGGEAGPSIMDEMVAVATQAKAAKRQQQAKERDSKGFGAGLKKGFFNQSKATKQQQPQKKKSPASTASAAGPKRLEVGETSSKKETALRIVDSPGTNQSSDAPSDGSSFVFPEVQDALKSMDQLNPNEWMNDQFFTKIAKHPKLLQALQNPRFSQAINELQHNPQAAVLKYQRDPDVSLMLRDFMEFLGNHFEELGKQQDSNPQQTQPSTVVAQPSTAPPASPSIVDLDETRRQAIANMARAPEEEAQVQRILENPELLAALSDAKLMEQLRQCQQDPRALQSLARDPVLGPKLRLLVEAKMVAFG